MFDWFLNWIGYSGSTTLNTPQQYVLAAVCVVGAVAMVETVELVVKLASYLLDRRK